MFWPTSLPFNFSSWASVVFLSPNYWIDLSLVSLLTSNSKLSIALVETKAGNTLLPATRPGPWRTHSHTAARNSECQQPLTGQWQWLHYTWHWDLPGPAWSVPSVLTHIHWWPLLPVSESVMAWLPDKCWNMMRAFRLSSLGNCYFLCLRGFSLSYFLFWLISALTSYKRNKHLCTYHRKLINVIILPFSLIF